MIDTPWTRAFLAELEYWFARCEVTPHHALAAQIAARLAALRVEPDRGTGDYADSRARFIDALDALLWNLLTTTH